ncbi:MAG TPA: thiamine pyrophosphate-binding protein [Microbacterium sp.]|uniref:thiamine pyrophosphate-binding protein n=1 Tax=Microbacterium sp. TaxID=51671 RepID=UPI002C5A518E|nr:thiamine pyrophosphate-binding protein [Microbacterium sp.]HWI31369.1 thiamine pyrophosphate-binding protein [Microbacterium sp.]
MSEQITVAEAVGRTIAALGASRVFGVVGSGNFYATNALVRAGVPFTAARHEMGASCMADAYSRATGRVAVVSLHQGCGFTNALTGIGEAAKCHTSILVITGDTADGDVTSNFYIDQDAAARAVGAVPERIYSARTAVRDAARAFATASLDRKTVVLSMPIDIQAQTIEWDSRSVPALQERHRPGPSPASVQRVAELLTAAERPVFVAGRGAWHAAPEIRSLADRVGALLTTSAAGRGLFAQDDWALDIMGGFSTDGAAALIADADLIIAFGAGLNNWTTRSGALLRDKTVVQVDDRLEALGWHHPVGVAVLGDTALTAAAVDDALARDDYQSPGYRGAITPDDVASVRYWTDQPVVSRAEPDRIDPREMTNRLDAILPAQRIVIPDGGNFNCYPAAHLKVPDQFGYCVPLSFQSIGLALSSAIGASIALPDRIAVAGIGDGGFLMSLVELDTAVRLGLGILVVVYNDSAYGAEVHVFEHDTDELSTVQFPETDIAGIARGFGCEGVTVRTVDDLARVQRWIDGPRSVPLVVDAKVAKFPSWVLAHAHAVEATGADLDAPGA